MRGAWPRSLVGTVLYGIFSVPTANRAAAGEESAPAPPSVGPLDAQQPGGRAEAPPWNSCRGLTWASSAAWRGGASAGVFPSSDLDTQLTGPARPPADGVLGPLQRLRLPGGPACPGAPGLTEMARHGGWGAGQRSQEAVVTRRPYQAAGAAFCSAFS